MQKVLRIRTYKKEGLFDITEHAEAFVAGSGIRQGLLNVYVQGATAAVMIQENWDDSVQNDVVSMLRKIIPHGVWQHDAQDDNGDAHLKAGLVGPQETIPVIDGKLGLSTWQNIFLCEFDGPREERVVILTLTGTQAIGGNVEFPG